MQLIDKMRLPTGRVRMEIRRYGKIIDIWDTGNLVVAAAITPMAHLAGGDTTGNSISKIGFGINSAPAQLTDQSLLSSYTKNIDSVQYPLAGSVLFNWSLSNLEDNGQPINELGLLTTAGTLFARVVRNQVLNKDNTISLNGTWTISF